MTEELKRRSMRNIFLCLCMMVFSCKDISCKDFMGSSLRHYDVSDRIKRINKELSSLEKKNNDPKALARMGDLHEQLATIYLEKEDLDTALIHINKSFGYGRNDPYLNYIAGLVFANKGAKSGSKEQIDKAEKYYRQAVAMKDNYNDAWYALAVLLFSFKNEREEPIKILESIYMRSRSDYYARFALGRVYYESGRKEDALDVYTKLQSDLEKLPDSPMIRDYRKSCAENIQRIRMEM